MAIKDPKGGLTAEGRRYFARKTGAQLKPGVKGATVSLDAKQARIAFDASQVSAETLAEAINRAGYKAVPTA